MQAVYEEVHPDKYVVYMNAAIIMFCALTVVLLHTCRVDKGMEMKENQAYGPVSSSQPPPPPASEGAYDL